MKTAQNHLNAIFEADRKLVEEEANLLKQPPKEVAEVLAQAVTEAKALSDREEMALRLQRLADLCAQVESPLMIEALIDILDDDEPSTRVAAGEALMDVAYGRYAEVARAIERRLDKEETGPAMTELPWIIAEIGEPGAARMLGRFLQSSEASVVASTIEALVTYRDPDAVELLEPLLQDVRSVAIVEGDNEYSSTVGELAQEAMAELIEQEDEQDDDSEIDSTRLN